MVARICAKQVTSRLFFFKKKRESHPPQVQIQNKGLSHVGPGEMG